MSDKGPLYGIELIDSLPIGGMVQAMPSRDDLEQVMRTNQRTVAGFEVLLHHYRQQHAELARLRTLCDAAVAWREAEKNTEAVCDNAAIRSFMGVRPMARSLAELEEVAARAELRALIDAESKS